MNVLCAVHKSRKLCDLLAFSTFSVFRIDLMYQGEDLKPETAIVGDGNASEIWFCFRLKVFIRYIL